MDDLNLTPAPDYNAPDFKAGEIPEQVRNDAGGVRNDVGVEQLVEAEKVVDVNPAVEPEPASAPQRPALAHLPGEEPKDTGRKIPEQVRNDDRSVRNDEGGRRNDETRSRNETEGPKMAGTPAMAKAPETTYVIPPHKSVMGWAIMITLFCCMFGGIIAIILSAKSNRLYSQAFYTTDSDLRRMLYLESESKNKKARTWIILSIVLGFLFMFAAVVVAALSEGEL